MGTTTVNENGILITKTIQKYLDIIESGKIEERQIISMKSLMNKDSKIGLLLNEKTYNAEGLLLSDAQNAKGYEFLLNQWRTPTGKERANSPFGYREEQILMGFDRFELAGFYEDANLYRAYYLPLYNVIDKEGRSFQYYYNGKVQIVG